MVNIFKHFNQNVGKIVEIQQNTHISKQYVSNSGYVIPVTPKKNPYLGKQYEISEKELQYSELEYRKLLKALQPYIDEKIITVNHKEMERSAHINILHNIPEGHLEKTLTYWWAKASTTGFASFSLQKGALYNLPYNTLTSFINRQITNFDELVNPAIDNKYSIETLVKYLNTIENIVKNHYKHNNLEYSPQIFANFLYLTRNVKSKNCTEDLNLWVEALNNHYREDEMWFALNKTYIAQCGGRIPPEIVKEYKTYLYLLKNSSV